MVKKTIKTIKTPWGNLSLNKNGEPNVIFILPKIKRIQKMKD